MKYTIGIDCGSKTIKLVLFSISQHSLIDAIVFDNNANPKDLINSEIAALLTKNHLDMTHIVKTASTGYGRYLSENSDFIQSEIICHAKGSNYFFPDINTVIDIGGQDSKIISVTNNGKVLDFVMNDKCAAGTGRFLEKVAQIFAIPIQSMDSLAQMKDKDISISSTCVVFAESEIIGLMNKGEKIENIIYSIYVSIAHRIFSQSGGLNLCGPAAFVGGVAYHKTMLQILSNLFNFNFMSPSNPSITGALGAAIIASEKYLKNV